MTLTLDLDRFLFPLWSHSTHIDSFLSFLPLFAPDGLPWAWKMETCI